MKSNLTLHEKINIRSHFDAGKRSHVPYDKQQLNTIREAGHSVKHFATTPYATRIDGTGFNKKSNRLIKRQ